MTTNGSEIAVIPKRFSGTRVLLIEPDHDSLVQHAYILSQNAYRVTSTSRVATGLSMVQNGHLYDCVLVDVDIPELDMVKFIHQVLRRNPELSIIVMAADDIATMRYITESVKNDGIMCLVKPCKLNEICSIWRHVYRNWLTPSERNDLNINSPYTNNNVIRSTGPVAGVGAVDPRFKSFPLLNRVMMGNNVNNNISHDLYYGTMFNKPAVYANNFISNEVGSSSTSMIRNIDYKGKQPMVMDNRQPMMMMMNNIRQPFEEEDDTSSQERGLDGKRRVYWTKALHRKFLEAVNVLGKENSCPSEILKHMKVPGLTRDHVATHLQKLQEGEKVMKRPRLVPVVETTDDNVQAGSKRSMKLTLTNNLNIQGPSKKLNSQGMSYMSLDNIKARLQDRPTFLLPPVPQPTTPTTTVITNNSVSDQVTNHTSGDIFQLPTLESPKITSPPTSGTSEDSIGFSDDLAPLCFNNYNSIDASGCGAMGEPLAEFDCFGIPIEPCQMIEMGSVEDHGLGGIEPWLVVDEPVVDHRKKYSHGTLGGTMAGETSNLSAMMIKSGTGGEVTAQGLGAPMSLNPFSMSSDGTTINGVETPISNPSEEDMALHDFVSYELGGLSEHTDQGNGDNLFMGFFHETAAAENNNEVFLPNLDNLEVADENVVGFDFPAGDQGSNMMNNIQAEIAPDYQPPAVNSNMFYFGGIEVEVDQEARVIFDPNVPFPEVANFEVGKTMHLLGDVDFGDVNDEEWAFLPPGPYSS